MFPQTVEQILLLIFFCSAIQCYSVLSRRHVDGGSEFRQYDLLDHHHLKNQSSN